MIKIKDIKINKAMIFGLLMTGVFLGLVLFYRPVPWWQADRSSAGIAPSPDAEKRAVVQVYAARTYSWRGWFSVHSWIAVKPENAKQYTTYQVLGYRLPRTGHSVAVEQDIPDRKWYGSTPELIEELRGEKAKTAIAKIEQLVKNYAYDDTYVLWPGPNSNTFVSHIIRNVPELSVELPPHAIGRDWLYGGKFWSVSESGSGRQFSLYGLLGFTIGKGEGIEISILGLDFGVDVLRPAVKLPFVGRIGLPDRPLKDD